MDCIFCAIVAGTAPAERVYDDDSTVAFLDIFPVTRGHTLVIPREHVSGLDEISESAGSAVMAAAIRVDKHLRGALQPDGMNLFQATGAVAGQTVFHFHVHLLPRYADDGFSIPFTRAPGDPDELRDLAQQIRTA